MTQVPKEPEELSVSGHCPSGGGSPALTTFLQPLFPHPGTLARAAVPMGPGGVAGDASPSQLHRVAPCAWPSCPARLDLWVRPTISPPHSHPLSRPSDSLTRALLQTISWAASLPLSPGCPQGSSSDLDLQVL